MSKEKCPLNSILSELHLEGGGAAFLFSGLLVFFFVICGKGCNVFSYMY